MRVPSARARTPEAGLVVTSQRGLHARKDLLRMGKRVLSAGRLW
jgi:hypothetical protein